MTPERKTEETLTELRRIRRERGIPQETLARQARIGQTSLSLYERGEQPVPEKVAKRLAKILRINPSEIFEEVSGR